MNNKKKLILTSFVAIATCVGVGLQFMSSIPSSVVNSTSGVQWRHYDRKAPTLAEKGIKEYWANCDGHNHQFVAPVSGTVVDMGSNYDTSEFTINDDRWITYCDEHGHNLDQYHVCSRCGQLDGDLISAKAINGSTSSSSVNPAKGFNSVYLASNVSRGSEVGVNLDISNYDYIYYALYVVPQDYLTYLCVYGGNPDTYAKMSPGSWYYVLLYRNKYNDNKLELYFRHTLSDSWESKVLDAADQTTTSFSKIRFYTWEKDSSQQYLVNYSVYCSEVYAIDAETYCAHTFDEHNVCTKCMKHKNAVQVYDYSISESSPSDSISAPEGFSNVYSATGKSAGYNGVDLQITQYNVLYFALYGTDYLLPFSGGENDNTHKIIAERWYYLLLERVNGSWTGYIRDGTSGSWVSRTVDGPNDTNFKSLLRLYNWGSGVPSITIYNTELYADETPITPTEITGGLNIGVWNGSYHFINTSSIDDMVDAGISTVIGVNPIWNSNWNNVLNYALSKGVKFIVDPRGWDYEHSCYADWDGTCPSYASNDAVLGFLMCDEPSALKYSEIAQLKTQFDAVMPAGKIFFVNLLSSAASQTGLFGDESVKPSYSYYETNYAQAYQNTVNPNIYSYDSYPLFTNGQIRKSYFATLDIWSNLSRTTGIPTWYTFLSSSHLSGDGDGYTYILPSKEQLKWQMSVAVSFGITNLMHYVFATDQADYTCMANINGSKNAYFDTVCDADEEMHYLDSELIKYTWEAATTYHNNSKKNLLFKELQHDVSNSQVGISNISATSDLLIGSYIKGDDHAYMVVNSGISTDYTSTWSKNYTDYNANIAYTNNANTVSITFSSNYSGAYVMKDGETTYVSASSNTININLDAYGSAFVIPVN